MTHHRPPVFFGWYVVVGSFLALFVVFGVIYSFGAFVTSLERAFDSSRAATVLALSIALFLANTAGVLPGRIADKRGPRLPVLAGAVLFTAGLLLASRATAPWQLYLAYGLGVGLGAAWAGIPSLGVVQHWFVRRRGFASGIANAGIGAGNLALPPVAGTLIHWMDWQAAFVIFGIAGAALLALAALIMARAPEDRGLHPDGDPDPPPGERRAAAATSMPKPSLRSRGFVLLYLSVVAAAFAIFVPLAHIVPDAEARGIAPVTASVLLGMIGGASLAARFIAGTLSDRAGRRPVLLLAIAGMAVSLLWWIAAAELWSLALFAVMFGAFFGGYFAMLPAPAADEFGAAHAGGVVGILYTGLAPGGLLGPLLAGVAYDRAGSYTLPIAACAVALVVSLGLLLAQAARSRPALATA
jgi:MFS family permease